MSDTAKAVRSESAGVMKPCPFCGWSDATAHEGSTFRWWVVECNNCGAQGPEIRRQTTGEGTNAEWDAKATATAIEDWNRRFP